MELKEAITQLKDAIWEVEDRCDKAAKKVKLPDFRHLSEVNVEQ